jgi:hypothetical protein
MLEQTVCGMTSAAGEPRAMNHLGDIEELLSAVTHLRTALEVEYESARNDENIKTILRPTVKSALEHLRSCLDYCALDIHAFYRLPPLARVYFPFGDTERVFEKSISKNLPNLDQASPAVFALIRSVQPFESGSFWLPRFARRTNELKHRSLGGQVREQSPKSFLHIGNYLKVESGSEVHIIDSTFGGDHVEYLRIDDSISTSDLKGNFPQTQVRREWEWVKFRFDESAEDVLSLIGETHDRLSDFMPRLYAYL